MFGIISTHKPCCMKTKFKLIHMRHEILKSPLFSNCLFWRFSPHYYNKSEGITRVQTAVMARMTVTNYERRFVHVS